MSWLTIFLWVGLPYAISIVRWFLTKKPESFKRPRTNFDLLVTSFLVATVVYWGSSALLKQPLNVLSAWDIKPNTPTYVTRRNFRDWMTRAYPGWVEGVTTSSGPGSSSFSEQDLIKMASFESLYESLKSQESRLYYFKFGHNAFTQCTWCKEGMDYSYYVIPEVVLSYCLMAMCLGIATMTFRKSPWRLYGTILLVAGVGYEIYLILISSLDSYVQAWSESMGSSPTFWDHIALYRCIAFAGLAGVVCLVDQMSDWTTEEKMAMIIAKQRAIYGRMYVGRLARSAMMEDSQLRGVFNDHYKREQAHMEAMMKDETNKGGNYSENKYWQPDR
ncbi:hypothetical protein HDU76_004313 [Blyttiomyces sp. JEL0837]|nr:hypothetical protein HDU76_004313 [Blyttiomyces sp. JEL0837]